jgi:hypothetical protein
MGGTTTTTTIASDPPKCPDVVHVTLPASAGLVPGDQLEVSLEGAAAPKVVLRTLAGVEIGVVAGVPKLQILIECLGNGVLYKGTVETVVGGAMNIAVARQ